MFKDGTAGAILSERACHVRCHVEYEPLLLSCLGCSTCAVSAVRQRGFEHSAYIQGRQRSDRHYACVL